VLFDLEDLLAERVKVEEELARAHAYVIRAYAQKRCFPLASEAARAARQALGEHPQILVAEGHAALAVDDRVLARERYELALEKDPRSMAARHARANLDYVLGAFDACRAMLREIPDSDRYGAPALRLEAACHAARQDHAAEARAFERVVALVPESDHGLRDRIAWGLALASAGDRERAREVFDEAWRRAPDSDSGRYARRRVEYLENAHAGTAHRRLEAFPTTAQKWNYCGPAVLELCLRYTGLELTQDEIADVVKRRNGTPMYEIVQYLRDRDIVARRIEATRARLTAAIDLGLPVIVQEEYSTTSHVAVITGYDESLGMFVANDPATHRPILKSFEWTERAGDLYGNGGVIVLGRGGPATDALAARCDEAGLVEARHLALLDEGDRLRPGASPDAREDATLHEVLRLCHDAIALAPRFKLAWHRRLDVANRLYRLTRRSDDLDRVLADLHHIRTTFANDEWPHQLHAHFLFDEGRFEEAFVEYFEASRRDPDDANNVQAMGECMWLAGDLARAERHLLDAITLEPFMVRAAENLAAIYSRQLQEMERDEDEDDARTLSPSEIHVPMERELEALVRRAEHFSRIALSTHPENTFNHEVAGDLALRREDFEGAVLSFSKAREMEPSRQWPLWGLAKALTALGRARDAEAVLRDAIERFPGVPRGYSTLAALLGDEGRAGEAAAVLTSGIEAMEHGREGLARELFDLLAETGSTEAAAGKLRELAERLARDSDLVREVGYLLDENGQRGHAVALLRHAVDASPSDVNAVYRLGSLLSEDLLTRDEGRALLERTTSLAPEAPQPRVKLAWLAMTSAEGGGDPDATKRAADAALAWLEPLEDREDSYVEETRAAALSLLGRDAEADEAAHRAMEAHGSLERGLLSLVSWHIDAMRYDRAVTLAKRIEVASLPEDLVAWGESTWLAAHRLSGRLREILPALRERVAEEVPRHLAFDAYWGVRSIDHEIAARAALAIADRAANDEERIRYRIHAAEERAHLGDSSMITEMRSEAGERAEAWASLSYAYVDLDRFDEANEAAERAYALDPADKEALSAMEGACVRRGDVGRAIACARALAEQYPYEHVGPERLGALLAKSLLVEEALTQSGIAVDAAPFCHNAHWSRAVALFSAGDLEGARRHAARSLAIEEQEKPDPGNDCVMILRALDRDRDGLERCLATLAKSEPESVFAKYKALLRSVARS
jgi:tetratricopeptide (TPR) repeat protein